MNSDRRLKTHSSEYTGSCIWIFPIGGFRFAFLAFVVAIGCPTTCRSSDLGPDSNADALTKDELSATALTPIATGERQRQPRGEDTHAESAQRLVNVASGSGATVGPSTATVARSDSIGPSVPEHPDGSTLDEESPFAQSPRCEMWYISSRHLPYFPSSCDASTSQLRYYRRVDRKWTRSDQEEFFGTMSPDTVLGIYVHGNKKQASNAKQRGAEIHAMLCCRNPRNNFRFVIWSWPSQKIPMQPIRDVRVKAARSVAQSYYFGSWLTNVDSRTRVTILSSSYGTRIAVGALHLLAGGSVNGNRVAHGGAHPAIRLFLVQPAFPCDWIVCGGKFGLSTQVVDNLFMAYNSRDFILKQYRRTIKDGKGDALGYTGLPSRGRTCASQETTLRQWDATRYVGLSHDYDRYKPVPYVQQKDAQYMLWQPVKPHP